MVAKYSRKIKILTCGLVSVLALSFVQLPKVHAVDNCFVTTPYQEITWNDPLRGDAFYVGVASKCKMKLYDLDVSFAGIESVEGLIRLPSDHNGLSGVEEYEDGLRLKWSGSKDEQEGTDYVEFDSSDTSWDDLLGYWYYVPILSLNPPETFKRNLPITINSARYEVDGEMKAVENLVLNSVAVITPDNDKEVLMISGVGKQDVSYTGQPVVLEGELTVEENDDGIAAEDLTEKYYLYDYSDLSFTPIDRPTDPGNLYLVEYTFENDNYRASLRVPFTIKDYITVNTDIWSGFGEVSAPAYIDKGGNLHVDIVPHDGCEVVWVEYNDDDVTELLNEDDSLDIEGVNESAKIVVAFRSVYRVTDGDGGVYVRGSGNNLAFVIDKEPTSYTAGMVLIAVDGEFVNLDNDSIVEPETKTTTLLSEYLDTLASGTHTFEMYFFDSNGLAGIARASFAIVETTESDNGSVLAVPDTGLFTGESGTAGNVGVIAVIVGMIVSVGSFIVLRKRAAKE